MTGEELAQALESTGSTAEQAIAYDITLIDTATGEAFEPLENVRVSIRRPEDFEGIISAYHIDDETTPLDMTMGENDISVDMPHFSMVLLAAAEAQVTIAQEKTEEAFTLANVITVTPALSGCEYGGNFEWQLSTDDGASWSVIATEAVNYAGDVPVRGIAFTAETGVMTITQPKGAADVAMKVRVKYTLDPAIPASYIESEPITIAEENPVTYIYLNPVTEDEKGADQKVIKYGGNDENNGYSPRLPVNTVSRALAVRGNQSPTEAEDNPVLVMNPVPVAADIDGACGGIATKFGRYDTIG